MQFRYQYINLLYPPDASSELLLFSVCFATTATCREIFTPQPLIVFTHGVRMVGRAAGWAVGGK